MMLVDLSGPTVIHNPPASPGTSIPPYTNADVLTPVMERGAKKASWAPPHPTPPGGSMTPSGAIRPTPVQDTTLDFLHSLHFCKYQGISKYGCTFTLFKQFVIDQSQRTYTPGEKEGRVGVILADWL